MKVKTSVTLSEDLLAQLDRFLGGKGSRSAVLERALREFLAARQRKKRDARDLRLLESHESELNEEALDVLDYQVET